MEVDSMHSAIETEKKHTDVFTMHDWVSIFRRAKRRLPYKVVSLHHQDFYDLQSLAQEIMKNRRRDEDGNVVNWLRVKSFRYVKDEPGVMYYKYNYSENYKRIFVYGRGRPSARLTLTPAYTGKHAISEPKRKDLLKLCTKLAIPEEFHGWYNAIPSSKRVTDRTPEPAAEDTE